MPVYLYVLESVSSKIFYVGMTTNLENRLLEHNSGKSKFTKGHLPWKIVYYEQVNDFKEGRIREKYLKSNAGKSFLKNILKKLDTSLSRMKHWVPRQRDAVGLGFPYGLLELLSKYFILFKRSLLDNWKAFFMLFRK